MEEGRNQRALGRQRHRFRQPVRKRSSWGEKWCTSGGVADESGAESEGFGTTEAMVWATGAEPVRFGGKVVQNRSSYGWKWCETGAVSDR
jgi:hypothetical protein